MGPMSSHPASQSSRLQTTALRITTRLSWSPTVTKLMCEHSQRERINRTFCQSAPMPSLWCNRVCKVSSSTQFTIFWSSPFRQRRQASAAPSRRHSPSTINTFRESSLRASRLRPGLLLPSKKNKNITWLMSQCPESKLRHQRIGNRQLWISCWPISRMILASMTALILMTLQQTLSQKKLTSLSRPRRALWKWPSRRSSLCRTVSRSTSTCRPATSSPR